jgi:predicted nucleotidyltransferase component of viral defense system
VKSSRQLNAHIRALSEKIQVAPQILLRFYLMENLLERISMSKYGRHFILKGGMLVASMVGIKTRSTMDIDAMMKDIAISENSIHEIFGELAAMNGESGIAMSVADVHEIREEAEYTGFRVSLNASFDRIRENFKVDVSVGDTVVPGAVEYGYPLLLEDRRIEVFAYPLEMVLAEKLETILSRGVANTRMRDFYDVFTLLKVFEGRLDVGRLKEALSAVSRSRGSEETLKNYRDIVDSIKSSPLMAGLWNIYAKKNSYAQNVQWQDTIMGMEALLPLIV